MAARERIWNRFWPRMGLRRYAIYLAKRVVRLSASPYAVAAGFACGAAVSVFPFFGFHIALGIALAFVLRASPVAAAIGTAVVGNPVTFPLIFALAYQIGHFILGRGVADASQAAHAHAAFSENGIFAEGLEAFWPVLEASIVGAVPLSIATFAIFYVVIHAVVVRMREAKRERLAERRAEMAARSHEEP